MALDDAGFVVPGTGFVYRAPVGTAAPTDITAPTTPWSVIGHVGTSDGDGLPKWTSDGGDVTVLGSWSKKAIKTITAPITESIEFSISQIGDEALELYTGGNGGTTAGQFEVLGTEIGVGTETALFLLIKDGSTNVGFYVPKASVARGDDIELDSEKPVMFPVSATFLDLDATTPRYTWIASFLNAGGV